MNSDCHKPALAILVVDDEPNIRKTLACCLESRGHRVTCAAQACEARQLAARQTWDLAFVDLRLGTENGLDLIPVLLGACPRIKIIVITAYASVATAVEAMKRGAVDYIPKPFTPDQVELVVERVATLHRMEERIATLKEDMKRLHPDVSFSSEHPGMRKAVELARQVAPTEAVVLIRGASGTGKTVLARAIHGWSSRAEKPFGSVSCPTLSPELLESELFGHVKGAFTGAVRDGLGRVAACEGGTLFLDEIGDLPLSVQAKLLRFIQDREYERVGDHQTRRADVRILVATHVDLEKAVKEGRFREDLYYRLNVIPIELPSLAERPDDIERLANDMLAFFGAQNHKGFHGFSDEAVRVLRGYAWPGNVRELRNAVERAAILCSSETVGPEYFPSLISPVSRSVGLGDPVSIEAIEEAHIRRVIASSRSLQEAADVLGIDQATLWRKRKQYGL
jgi:NtrC-family two-component system response regulator AlgB